MVTYQLQTIKTEKNRDQKNGDQDLVRLMKAKEESENTILKLKEEIILMKKTYEGRCQQMDNSAVVIKTQLEESKKYDDQDVVKLLKDKEDSYNIISELRQEIEATKKKYESRCQQLESNYDVIKAQLEENNDQDVDRLMKEKEDSDALILELKQEIEKTKKTYEIRRQELEESTEALRAQLEENKKNCDQDMVRLMKEKKDSETIISELKQEIDMTKKTYESRCQQLENKAEATKAQLEESIKHGAQDIDRLIKEKEVSNCIVSELEQKIEMTKTTCERRCQQMENNTEVIKAQLEESKKHGDQDIIRLTKEKENRDSVISKLEQEIEMTKKTYESRFIQLENDAEVIKAQLEESKKHGDQDIFRLMKEKEDRDSVISKLEQEIEMTKRTYENRCLQLENDAADIKAQLDESKKLGEQDIVRLMKEKEDRDSVISKLEQEIDMTKKTYEGCCLQLENNTEAIKTQMEEMKKNSHQDIARLIREKEDIDCINLKLKQEIELTKKTYETRCQQLENNAEEIKTQLDEVKKHGDQDTARLMKEKEDKDCIISELKQEIELTKKAYESRCQQLENSAEVIKTELEEAKKHGDQDMLRLMKEKEDRDCTISELKHEMEATKNVYESQRQKLENDAKGIKVQLEDKIKDVETLLLESRKQTKELEAFSELNLQKWNKKEHTLQNSICFQLESMKNLKLASQCIKHEVIQTQSGWKDEISQLGTKLKVLVEAAENYRTVFAENLKLYNEVQDLKGNIRVYCRIRPFLPGQNGKSTIIDHVGDNGEVLIVNPSKQGKDARRLFKFSKTYGPRSTQEQVYSDIQPLIRSVLDGYNVCIFAYGQTGSGKTYTMMGPNSPSKEEWGVNYRALDDLFQISCTRSNVFLYEISVQIVEIYNEQVRDLLSTDASQKRLGILNTSQADGLAVPDATMLPVKSTSDVLELMQCGLKNRAMSSTALNERSSRSHSVVTVHVRGEDLKTGSRSRGSLHLVDLAGSERIDRSEVTGDRLKEAQHINKSLSALGDVIFALSQKSSHIPYRNSKLTQLLQSSLGGQAKTLMFVQVNPDVESHSETTSTLKFAERVSGVELGAARSSKEGKDVKDLMEQVATLKDMIAKKDEEIEHLQLLKDGVAQQGQRVLSGRSPTSNDLASQDGDNDSEFSDKRSEAGSLRSVNELKHHKENLNGEEIVDELSGEDIEERLSDVSEGAEDDTSERADSILHRKNGKPSDVTRERISKAPSRLSRPLSMRTGTTAVRPTLRDLTKKTSVPRRTTTSQASVSAARPLKR